MRADAPVVVSPPETARPFPFASLAWFAIGAACLRALAMAAWALFPTGGLMPQIARVAIPLGVVAGLVALNQRFLVKEGFGRGCLGLEPRRVGWFAVGGLAGVAWILALAGALWLLVPFHWERGSMSWTRLAWQGAEYFTGNAGEELAFRGFLLLALARSLGLAKALAIVAFLFGLFHLPGLSGLEAVKMVCTTALGSYLFAYCYLLTGSLWGAIGMHVVGNLVLHQTLGLSGGEGIVTPVLRASWPESYDPAFVVWVAVSAPLAIGGYWLARRRSESLWR